MSNRLKPYLSLAALFCSLCSAAAAFAAPQVFILSGGDKPESNHYSQYLQTKELASHLSKRFAADDFKVLFASGQRPGQVASLADVYKFSGGKTEMIVGEIPGNRAAVPREVMNALDELSVRKTSNQDPFFMVVTDHGMPNQVRGMRDETYSDNCISLWGYEVVDGKGRSASFDGTCLSKSRLSSFLDKGFSGRKQVFAMTQCYSGGFHQMSVRMENGYPTANPSRCGFSSAPPNSMASGCTSDVDGDRWQGYERFFAERLVGRNLVTNKAYLKSAASFKEAHYAATLEDMTLDIPMTTSETYLLSWYDTLNQKNFQSRAQTISDHSRLVFDLASSLEPERSIPGLDLNAYEEKRSFALKMAQAAEKKFPVLGTLLSKGKVPDLSKRMNEYKLKGEEFKKKYDGLETEVSSQYGLLYFYWRLAIEQGDPTLGLGEYQRSLELGSFGPWVDSYGHGIAHDRGIRALALSLANSESLETKLFNTHLDRREQQMLDWAKSSTDPKLVELFKKYQAKSAEKATVEAQLDLNARLFAQVKRALLYRLELGTWVVLAQIQDQKALTELSGLLDCEATPLPVQ